MIMRNQKVVVAGAVLAAVLVMTGCGATTSAESSPDTQEQTVETTQPEVIETPAPEPTPTQEPAPVPGEEEGPQLPVYTTASGVAVTIDPHAPLPAEVVAEIKAVGVLASGAAPTYDERHAMSQYLSDAADKIIYTGKIPVFVFVSGAYEMDGSLISSFYNLSAREPGFNGVALGSADEAISLAQSIIATRPDPSIYQVIDLTR